MRDDRHLHPRPRPAAARRRRPGRLHDRRRLWRGDELDLQQPPAGARGAGRRRAASRSSARGRATTTCLALDTSPTGSIRRVPTSRASAHDRPPGIRSAVAVAAAAVARRAGVGAAVAGAVAGAVRRRVFAVAGAVRSARLGAGHVHAGVLAGFAAPSSARVLGSAAGSSGRTRSPRGAASSSASGLAHRPLAALADQPSTPLDAAAASAVGGAPRRMAAAVRGLRVGWPAAGLARRDPWGLRAVLAILLLVGAIDAGADWRERLVRALTPGWEGGAGRRSRPASTSGSPRPTTPGCRRNSCAPTPRARCACRPAARCWRRSMAAAACRVSRSTPTRAISRRSTRTISAPRRC